MDKMYRVTVSLSTVVSASDKFEAMEAVSDTLPDEFVFGEFGNMLPFEYEGMETENITDEDIGRP
jgi:hypothetical protein